MYDLIILTTAICRPELHSKCLRSFSDDLKNQKIHAHWLVNIDPALGDQKNTFNNFVDIIGSISNTISTPEQPCFFTAANKLIKECYTNYFKLLNDSGYVMWLEDDKNHEISFNIQELISSNYDYIGFHPNHLFEFSFHPSMWAKKFFLNHVYQPYLENNDAKKDPEQLLIDYHRNKRKERKDHFQDVNRIHFNGVFNHVGREWNDQNNVKKWNKNINGSSVSYEKGT